MNLEPQKWLRAGKPALIGCQKEDQEEIIAVIYKKLKPQLNITKRNNSDFIRHALLEYWNRDNNDFEDLYQISKKFFNAAGFRDAFEGLAIIDVRSMARKRECDIERLNALAEAIEIWGKRAYTVFLGPGETPDMLSRIANGLDIHGDLPVELVTEREQSRDIRGLLNQMGIKSEDDVIRTLEELLAKYENAEGFVLKRAIKSIAKDNLYITMAMIKKEEESKLGYISRHKPLCGNENGRRIGFTTHQRNPAETNDLERM